MHYTIFHLHTLLDTDVYSGVLTHSVACFITSRHGLISIITVSLSPEMNSAVFHIAVVFYPSLSLNVTQQCGDCNVMWIVKLVLHWLCHPCKSSFTDMIMFYTSTLKAAIYVPSVKV